MGLVAAIFALAGRRIHSGARQPGHRTRPDARTRRDAAGKARPAVGPFRVAGGDPLHRCDLPVRASPCRAALFWLARLPQLWADLQLQLSELKGPLEALKSVRDQLRELTGGEGVTVSVDEGMGVESMATLAPAVVAQILIFFACLYFFVATRHQTRTAILKLCLEPPPALACRAYLPGRRAHGVALPSVDHHHQHPGGVCGRRRALPHRSSLRAAVGRARRADQLRRLHRPNRHGRHPVHGRPRRIRHAWRQLSAGRDLSRHQRDRGAVRDARWSSAAR